MDHRDHKAVEFQIKDAITIYVDDNKAAGEIDMLEG